MHSYITGQLFDGRKAAEIGLVNEAVPKEKLREKAGLYIITPLCYT
jgi:trans-feruloyl-CoA hydratase/vanillin synthase